VIGGIAHATSRLRLGTAVTCPSFRVHPAIVAQAAATCALMMPGRFSLGVGTGENLNEHVVGQGWPETEIRQARLAEAIRVIRQLWKGGVQSHRNDFFTVENARLYSLSRTPPPLLVAIGGPRGAELAGDLGDGAIATGPERRLLEAFRKAGGAGKPTYGEVTVCWGRDERKARQLARERWPTAAMESALSWELPLPANFEAVAGLVTADAVAESVTCGPDPRRHLEAIERYAHAGRLAKWTPARRREPTAGSPPRARARLMCGQPVSPSRARLAASCFSGLARLRGTFLPFFRASERPIAIACLRLLTVPPFPPLPLLSVPRFRRRIALATSLLAPLLYSVPRDAFRAIWALHSSLILP